MRRASMLLCLLVSAVLLTPALAWGQDAEAEKLYKARCLSCHAADGKGDTPAGKKTGTRDFAAPEVWKMTDAQWIEITTKGHNKMPAYGKTLKPEQIKALVAYSRELVKDRAPK
jgi:cytochrome c6